MAVQLSIPGNIKQMFLPFVLDPSAQLNQPALNQAKNVSGKPQIFSFRNTTLTYNAIGATGKINICPSSFAQNMANDISFKLLYKQNGSKSSIDLNTIYDSIPGMQIREFLPDTSLDQTLDLFSKVWEAMMSAGSNAMNFAIDNIKNLLKGKGLKDLDKITRASEFAVKYLTGVTDENFYSNGFDEQLVPLSSCKDSGKLTTYVYKFTYIMWYLLQSTTTTNIYELPCKVDGNSMYYSDGSKGWPAAGFSFGLPGSNGSGMLSKLTSMLTGGLSKLFGNMNISLMPWWDAKKGNETPHKKVTVKFDLFNDTADNALFNFIFINTIMPNAKWIQYNMFQHSPHLYDIKLEGYDRLYACSGQFEVTYDGVLRDMSEKWIDIYLKPRINACMSGNFLSNIKRNKLIKIPDIYHVTMSFESLIPDTFNNYLFTFSENANITNEYKDKVRSESVAKKILDDNIDKLAAKVKEEYNK